MTTSVQVHDEMGACIILQLTWVTQQQPVACTHSEYCRSVLLSLGEDAVKTARALEAESMILHTHIYIWTCGFVLFKLYAVSCHRSHCINVAT